MPNKIGILTYYWPPAGGSGVQRWLRFSNELAKLGHDVHVLLLKIQSIQLWIMNY